MVGGGYWLMVYCSYIYVLYKIYIIYIIISYLYTVGRRCCARDYADFCS